MKKNNEILIQQIKPLVVSRKKTTIYQVQVGSKLPTPRYISDAAPHALLNFNPCPNANDASRSKARPTCGV